LVKAVKMCLATIFLCGTLVVLVPTKEGIIIAADSRGATANHAFCDEVSKLIEIESGPVHTVATLTGLSEVLTSRKDQDVCQRLREGAIWLDLKKEFKSFVEAQSGTAATITIGGFVPKLTEAFATLPSAEVPFLQSLVGKTISQLIIASYDPETSTSWIRHAILSVTSDTKPVILGEVVEKISLEHSKMIYRWGETEYADSQLTNGALSRAFVKKDTFRFFTSQGIVRYVTKDQSISAAVDYIEAVSAAASKSNPPVGIGGPVDVLFIGSEMRPQRVRWKNLMR
jgi:hypothetical protein